jgi:hypothetical protein
MKTNQSSKVLADILSQIGVYLLSNLVSNELLTL